MRSWEKLAVAVAVPGGAILLVLLAVLVLHCRRRRRPPLSNVEENKQLPLKAKSTKETLQSGISRLRRSYGSDAAALRFQHLDRNRRREAHRCCELHRPGNGFVWGDNPVLVAEAAEGGWSRFAFMGRSDSPPLSASLLGSCVACDTGRTGGAEVGWEVPVGSSDFLQTVRLNPAVSAAAYGGARMSLPLPGPPLGGDPPSFPQESYFEVTVLHLHPPPPPPPAQHRHPLRWSKRVKDSSGGGDRRKLMSDTFADAAILSENPTQGGAAAASCPAQEPDKPHSEEQFKEEESILCLGLTGGGAPAEKPPGSYPGSIGFNSNGSVHLDGMKLVIESDKARWSSANRVVGCGFEPGKKTIFFTMDSVLLHVVHCNSDVFRSPLYPTLVSNSDAKVLVNLGQCPFKYSPANAYRTPDPCFLRPGPVEPSAHIGYDDSRELFSMGRIDSQWMAGARRAQFNGGMSVAGGRVGGSDGDSVGEDYRDFDAESDLFEISLNR